VAVGEHVHGHAWLECFVKFGRCTGVMSTVLDRSVFGWFSDGYPEGGA
jgi:hypothetical protein